MRLLVIDIGGTFIKYAVMDENREILGKGKIPTPQDCAADLVEALGRLYDENPGMEGIAISMPGIVDSDRGICLMGGALRYNDGFALAEALRQRTGTRIYMENDAKCAAMAEAAAGSLKDVQDGMVIIFGTMVGGGIIKDGKLWRGKHFSAGEVSYISSDRTARPDKDTIWGNRCSVLSLCRAYAEMTGEDPETVNGERVFAAVNAGEERSLRCLDAFTKEVAVQLFNLQTILDPEAFAIGGGISAQPVFIDYIRKNLQAIYDRFPYPVTKARVVPCSFQNDANLYGAYQCFVGEML